LSFAVMSISSAGHGLQPRELAGGSNVRVTSVADRTADRHAAHPCALC
jgi:hypothetical protein